MQKYIFALSASALTLAVAGWLTLPAVGQTAPSSPAAAGGPVILAQATKGSPDERADQLVRQMTIAEKVSLLSGNQFVTHAIDRLGIPGFAMSDGPNGVRNGPNGLNQGCAFPCGAALAATW